MGIVGETHPSVIRVTVGAHQYFAFPEQIYGLVTPESGCGVDVAHGDALNDAFDDPAQGSDAIDELLTQLLGGEAVVDDHGTECLEGPAQPEVCHAGAGVSAADGTAMRAKGVTTAALRTRARRAFGFALCGAALADEAVATAKPVTMVSETAAAAKRRRADVVEEVEVMH